MAACQRVLFFVLVSLDRDRFMDGTRCTFSLVRVYKPGRHPGRCDSGTANQIIVLCGITYCIFFVQNPPFHLFTIVFCSSLILVLCFKREVNRLLALLCFYDFIGSYGLFCPSINK